MSIPIKETRGENAIKRQILVQLTNSEYAQIVKAAEEQNLPIVQTIRNALAAQLGIKFRKRYYNRRPLKKERKP